MNTALKYVTIIRQEGENMQRYFLESQENVITAENAYHIKTVMRMKKGDHIEVCYPNKRCYIAALTQVTDVIQFQEIKEIISQNKLPEVVLIQGLPKSDKAEITTKYATQFGVSSIIFTEMTYSIAKMDPKKDDKKVDRLQKIAIESARLAHRNDYPIITYQKSISKISYEDAIILLAYEQEKTTTIKEVLGYSQSDKKIILIVGPEGGISPVELDFFTKLGAKSISLGKRILQTEIAAIYALSVIDSIYE